MSPVPMPEDRDLKNLPLNVWWVGQEGVETQRAGHYLLPSVRAHPGKMLPLLARRLIESYTRPGDWILDPLSGIGTTGVEAVSRDRHYVGIELERRFVRLQRENLQAACRRGARGRFAVFRGDARRLDSGFEREPIRERALSGPVDVVLTSPPYGDRLRADRSPGSHQLRERIRRGELKRGLIPSYYGEGRQNLGNLEGTAYLEGMRHVYRGCYEVLKPGGLLILVLQPSRQARLLRPLHHEAARLCTEIGFELLDEIVALLCRVSPAPGGEIRAVAHASFFRRLALAHLREAGWPVTLGQVEYVLLFRKPGPLPAVALLPLPQGDAAAETAKAAVTPLLPAQTLPR